MKVLEYKQRSTMEFSPYLSNFDRSATQDGDAWQGTAFTTLWVGDHSAVTTLQGDLSELDPLATRYTRLWLDYLCVR